MFLIPVISPIHAERASGPILRARSLLEDSNLKVYGPRKPLRTGEELPNLKTEEYDSVVVFAGSGGTGSLIGKITKGRDWFIWSYDENNSLPSALSAREKMVAEGGWRGKLVYNDLSQAPQEIVAEAYATRTLKTLRGAKIVLIGDEEGELKEWEPTREFLKGHLQIETVPIPTEKLRSAMKHVSVDQISAVSKERLRNIEFVGASQGDVEKSLRLYLALKGIVDETASRGLALDCYRFMRRTGMTPCLALTLLNDDGVQGMCEGDLEAGPLMLLLHAISGQPVWIANIAKLDLKNGIVTLAHCSAPMKLSEPEGVTRLMSHFESSLGVSLDVPLRRGNVTLAHFSLNPAKLVACTGEVIESQLGHWKLSRTQADVKLNCNPTAFLEGTGNHQTVSYGEYAPILIQIAKKLQIAPQLVQ